MRSEGLIGKQVVGSGGWTIGRIKGIVFDETNWRIGSLEVDLDPNVAKEYEMNKLLSRTTVNVDVNAVHGIGDHVILSISKPQLRALVSHTQ
jgi:sporulation protein YlmC with PRC-barrel domain